MSVTRDTKSCSKLSREFFASARSRSTPKMLPSSSTPINRVPPCEFRNAAIVFSDDSRRALFCSPFTTSHWNVLLNSRMELSPNSMRSVIGLRFVSSGSLIKFAMNSLSL